MSSWRHVAAALLLGMAASSPPASATPVGPSASSAPTAVQVAQPPVPAGPVDSVALPDTAVHPGEHLRVEVLTMGQGDLVWEKFGHNAVRVVDTRRGTDVSWNWGVFDFDQENFWSRLITGRMLYRMAGFETDRTLYEYDYFDRPVWSQELDMTPAQKVRLQEILEEHYRPENREYHYDYYRDNCSTRVRDVLDEALGGALRSELADDTTGTTFRWHTRRLLGGSPLPYLGIQLVLGNRADRPVTEWEETFLPMRLQRYLREVSLTGPDGSTRPLVRREVQLVGTERPATPERAPSRLGWMAAIGLALGAVVAVSAVRGAGGSTAGRVVFVAVAGGWALAAGVGGAVIVGAWLFTSHTFWALNENLLQADPLCLALVPMLVPLAWRDRPARGAARLAVAVAALSVVGFLMQPLPGLDQVNGEIIALALPVNLAVAYGLLALREPSSARDAGG